MYDEALEAIFGFAVKALKADRSSLTADISLLDDLGGRSFDVSHLAIYLEGEFDIEVPYMKFSKCKTLGDMAQFVADCL